ncbi:MAG: hypothetical protein UX74_C0011G0017 [Parcubacteria group bacterium GW2011_GWA2_47_10b]|uniref:Uncharacterized protein n=1 Tax=Candidatus Ryanbacteria bacterium RIFCSPLOWO2_02_FULL_47_14 TaxID=1802129 RepID=A0A1G2H2W0_9BACT|nr:MAG: hypothetical protein UX74_C0011G0017 [Parcubacteria group bacterium GW2011_GWA2_47_10b]KKU86089.1 MAG: hypothetical protein UY14_C0007G0021 [Parcubacteria group bacterium GW2011_GWA1_47_9]OGZ44747.1 MAG: hypothetical protein A2844_01895 [Candidatus Ryanbacteria bacterium RIFCSPHIGHO2_01_FULL_48_80]OGZ52217.1 MAG: hypothetical protein A3A29_02895 [Candidatus Ryanbacteria bacterium RIFCSPLOWO2_01_FULL_47_79]OGZ56807.1 MAG: hypothetical protein A3J04_03240 [Candidatus Ryanbacteria bacteriu
MVEVLLTNEAQGEYFRQIRKHRLPKFFQTFFADFGSALDFLSAFAKYRVDFTLDSWAVEHIQVPVRAQLLALKPEVVEKFVTVALEGVLKKKYDFNALLIPFGTARRDTQHAVRVWELILGAILQENFLNKSPVSTIVLVPYLVETQYTTHSWALLAEGVAARDAAAVKAFTRLLTLFALIHIVPRFVPVDPPESSFGFQSLDILEVPRRYLQSTDPLNPTPVSFPVPSDAAYACNRFYRRLAEGSHAAFTKLVKLLSWFGAYEESFQRDAHNMWEEIRSDPKYGLRPGGRDVVSIEVAALRGHGYRHIQLIPGAEFPQFSANVWLYFPKTETRVVTSRNVEPGPLVHGDATEDPQSVDALADKLLQFIALHSFWKIVTGKIFHSQRRNSVGTEERRMEIERKFLLRPHFRWLLPSHNPSERARARSLKVFGYAPPPGKTFVMSDSDAPTSSCSAERFLHAYTDEDLGYSE